MTVIARRIVAEPVRLATETWKTIVDLLAPDANDKARSELLAVTGIASSLIAAEVMQDAPAVVYGSGPRIRFYCLYGEDAIVGEDANETALPGSPVSGDWSLSLPCLADDLEWVQAALKKQSTRITARDMSMPIDDDTSSNANDKSATIDREAFFRS
jgi:hypothetical protein